MRKYMTFQGLKYTGANPRFKKGLYLKGSPQPVICKETGKKYDSIKQAAEELNLKPFDISRHIRKDHPETVGGYHFTYS